MKNWKPFKTAPRDGTYIIAKRSGIYLKSQVYIPVIVSYRDGDEGVGWYEVNGESKHNYYDEWMSLPKSDCGNDYWKEEAPMPQIKDNPDLHNLKDMLKRYVQGEKIDTQIVFEEAMETFYGKRIFDYINKNDLHS